MKQKTAVIGSGVAGIASAIRLAAKGYEVSVFEKNAEPGGKLAQLKTGGFRFDKGPSLFTLPEMVEELFLLCNKKPENYFSYRALESSCKYFFEDGTIINAWQKTDDFANEIAQSCGIAPSRVADFLSKSKRLYEITGEVFLFNSIHKISNFRLPAYRKALFHLHELDVFTTMHRKNKKWFKDPRVVQLFDRYATYNGSNPYKTPATLNVIPHLEHNIGAFFPNKGMYHIVESLYELAKEMGVRFFFNRPVDKILIKDKKVSGILTEGEIIHFDHVVSDVDVVMLYKHLLPDLPFPKKQLSLERSSSAMIFYWGIDRQFDDLGLHNILFSHDYKSEFEFLFNRKSISDDPTVYIFISSKVVQGDAPPGKENWYVMINAPENIGQDWNDLVKKARQNIINKIKRITGIDINNHILTEHIADPVTIEQETASYNGSLYGLSSNNMFAAFYRHPNSKKSIKNLYFTGGSVHPGGGIPLALASAKIIDREFPVNK
ncbi:MAG: phytoene desaturase [Bacteroidia bacterium]|nr:MAG: phytoene desaturase [Bacteroidia bacterium]